MCEKIKNKMQIEFVNIKKINVSPYQSRNFFSNESLKSLTDSIKKYGLLQPILLKKISVDLYEIISGERRFRACKLLNYDEIPALIFDLKQKDCLCMALAENIIRSDLNFFEEAEGIKNILIDCEVSVNDLAAILNKTEEDILNKLYLLGLGKNIKETILKNNLGEEFALEILKINSEQAQKEILDKIIYYGLSIKTTKRIIKKILNNVPENKFKNKNHICDLRIFLNTLKQVITITNASGFDAKYNITQDNLSEIKINIQIKKRQIKKHA